VPDDGPPRCRSELQAAADGNVSSPGVTVTISVTSPISLPAPVPVSVSVSVAVTVSIPIHILPQPVQAMAKDLRGVRVFVDVDEAVGLVLRSLAG
jgi:hypothetical protein